MKIIETINTCFFYIIKRTNYKIKNLTGEQITAKKDQEDVKTNQSRRNKYYRDIKF